MGKQENAGGGGWIVPEDDEPVDLMPTGPGESEIVVTPESADLEVVRRALLTGDVTLEVDPALIARQIVEQIITAPDVEAAFREAPVWHANEFIGREFILRGVRWLPSSFEGGPAVFAAASAVDTTTGEVGILTTSAYKQMAKLYVLARDGGFPVKVLNTQSERPTAGGFWPMDFSLVAEPPEA